MPLANRTIMQSVFKASNGVLGNNLASQLNRNVSKVSFFSPRQVAPYSFTWIE